MPQDAQNKAAIPNPKLKPLSVLVGEWETVGKHRLLPDTPIQGHASFEWVQGGAFLRQHLEMELEGFPSAIAIFGSDDASDELTMLYFDERAVSRVFAATLRDNVWKWWRNAPGFSQRMTGTISIDGNTIHVLAELQEADGVWKRDMEVTYTRKSR